MPPLVPRIALVFIYFRFVSVQMEWHSGKTLSQSVFTILFVHHLPDINPEYLPLEDDEDPKRPQELITVVLRAGMLGLLKCCDMAWRELSKNRVHDVSLSLTVCRVTRHLLACFRLKTGKAKSATYPCLKVSTPTSSCICWMPLVAGYANLTSQKPKRPLCATGCCYARYFHRSIPFRNRNS